MTEIPLRSSQTFLIVGTPRSGTGYMAEAFTNLGYHVGHEFFGAYGISSWVNAASSDDVPFGVSAAGLRFDHVIHVVRDPLKTLASMCFTELVQRKTVNFIRRFVMLPHEANPIAETVSAWLGWNKLIEARKPAARLRVETAWSDLPELLAAWNWPVNIDATEPPRDYNSRPHSSLTWTEVESAVCPGLFREAQDYAVSLGYEI